MSVAWWFDKLFSYLSPHPSHFILSVAWEDIKKLGCSLPEGEDGLQGEFATDMIIIHLFN